MCKRQEDDTESPLWHPKLERIPIHSMKRSVRIVCTKGHQYIFSREMEKPKKCLKTHCTSRVKIEGEPQDVLDDNPEPSRFIASPEGIAEIVRLLKDKERQQDIANAVGCSRAYVAHIKKHHLV